MSETQPSGTASLPSQPSVAERTLELQSKQIRGTLAIALAGILTAAASLWQLVVMQDQLAETKRSVDAVAEANDISRQALIASQRPWVGLDKLVVDPPRANEAFHADGRIDNDGHSPAINTSASFEVYLAPADSPQPIASPCSECGRHVLLPGRGINFGPQLAASVMTPDALQRIANEQERLWLVGRIDYYDTQGNPHVTTICLYWSVKPRQGFTACREGNDAN